MPFLFLSPSTQYFNPYITTGDERYWMNALADEMTPYLHASGITVTRNNPDGSAAQSIRDSNAGQYDFHLALHSNAMPEASAGTARGVDIYYSPMSEAGLRMARKPLGMCDEMWVFGDEISEGMVGEIIEASDRCIPIYHYDGPITLTIARDGKDPNRWSWHI